jgi:hypothetical protein
MRRKWTTGRLARALDMSPRTINEMIRTGRIMAVRPMAGLRWNIPFPEAQRVAALAGVKLEDG